LQVKDPVGQVIATCLFPHDNKTIYYWCGGSRLSGWKYSPNDLIHWSAMEWGIKHGLTVYNMCGYGNFKSKFGGPLEEPRRWQKYYSTMARWGRAAYARYHSTRIKVRGNWERLKHPPWETA
jgi:lipid II:glycine glycyltransferase (peptidoglycan interpeptide bridge formation enzyme)